MIQIEAVNHLGIRVRNRDIATGFYSELGFELVHDAGFEEGHPIVMRHPSGVVLNLLGPATSTVGDNVLMDVAEKHTGITHVALTVSSIADTRKVLADKKIDITGSFSFGDMSAIFIRDPDRNVIELDAYGGAEVSEGDGYSDHPA